VLVRCLRDANVHFRDLDGVILVGGASRMHVIADLVRGLEPGAVYDEIDPDLVVVEGAAWQSGLVERDEAVREVVLTDVCPHSLGVEVARHLPGGRIESGYFQPIIDRNTTLPVSRSESFSAMELSGYPGQTPRNHRHRPRGAAAAPVPPPPGGGARRPR